MIVPAPVLSLVFAMYGVAQYLPALLAGLDKQAEELRQVELIFVDDGSPDDAAALVDTWRDAHPERTVRLIRQANAGAAAARNAGLAVATGTWVSFPDPDDVLAPGYLAEVLRFADSPEADGVALIATNLLRLEQGRVVDRHLLRQRFAGGARIADLTAEPDLVVVSASHTFLRRDVLVARGLRQDERVRPVWEDGHLVARYLGTFARPRVALLPDAHYLYRRRTDGSSALQGAWSDSRKFSDVPRAGWLDALRFVRAERGAVPPWLAQMILYDLVGYFERERQTPSPTAWLSPDQEADFWTAVGEVLEHIDAAAVAAYRTTDLAPEIRLALLAAKGEPPSPTARVDRVDADRGIERVRYPVAAAPPTEAFAVDGSPVRPRFAKYAELEFFGRALLRERLAWVPSGGRVTLELDGRAVTVTRPPEASGPALRESAPTRARAAALRLAARTPWMSGRFGNAWLVLADDEDADGAGERFYRWLRTDRAEVNAWFLLRRDSPSWKRLEREGARLVAYRSPQHYLALLHAKHLISSRLDRHVTGILPRVIGRPGWKLTWLCSGPTATTEPVDLVAVATAEVQQALTGPATELTELEVRVLPEPEQVYAAIRELHRPLAADAVTTSAS